MYGQDEACPNHTVDNKKKGKKKGGFAKAKNLRYKKREVFLKRKKGGEINKRKPAKPLLGREASKEVKNCGGEEASSQQPAAQQPPAIH